jgi:hypothetical protein
MDAMLKMQKIIVADLQKAHDGYSCPEKFFPKTCQVWRRKDLSGYL